MLRTWKHSVQRALELNFMFYVLQGEKGDKGDRGLTATFKGDKFSTGIIEGPPGPPGPPGIYVVLHMLHLIFLVPNGTRSRFL